MGRSSNVRHTRPEHLYVGVGPVRTFDGSDFVRLSSDTLSDIGQGAFSLAALMRKPDSAGTVLSNNPFQFSNNATPGTTLTCRTTPGCWQS